MRKFKKSRTNNLNYKDIEKAATDVPNKKEMKEMKFATIEDLNILWRPLRQEEIQKAEALIEIVSDRLREEAHNVGKELDKMVEERTSYKNLVKSVVVDVVARTLMTSTDSEPMTQMTQSALGYSFSGTYLSPRRRYIY